MPKPPKKTINIDEEVYRFMDMISRNITPIQTIEKLIMETSKRWERQEKVLFRKIIKEKLQEYIINNFNQK